jgi:hypothetical protein
MNQRVRPVNGRCEPLQQGNPIILPDQVSRFVDQHRLKFLHRELGHVIGRQNDLRMQSSDRRGCADLVRDDNSQRPPQSEPLLHSFNQTGESVSFERGRVAANSTSGQPAVDHPREKEN